MFFRLFGYHLIFLFTFISCSEEPSPKALSNTLSMVERNNVFYGYRYADYNEKINSIAYNNKTHSIIFSLEPVPAKGVSAYEFDFKPTKPLNSEIFSNNFKLKAHSTKPNKLIETSLNGKYLAFASWNGELILKQNGSIYSKIHFESDITSLRFIDKLLAIGDKNGVVTLYDIEKKKIHTSIKLFNGYVTSIESFKNSQFFVSGSSSTLFQVDGISGKIINSFNTRNRIEKLLIFSGINHCLMDQINKILYIPEKDALVTSHGWGFCSFPKIKVWDVKTLKIIYQSKILEGPITEMVWFPNNQEIIFADEKPSFWTLNLNNLKAERNIQFHKFLNLFKNTNGKKKILRKNFELGIINTIKLIPNTDIFIMGLGSYYRGGSALLISQKKSSGFNHLVFIGKSKSLMYLFTPEESKPTST